MDYAGVMGVPISFLDKYNPEQFEIVKFRKGDDEKDLSINGKCPFFRILIKNKKMLVSTVGFDKLNQREGGVGFDGLNQQDSVA